MYEIIGTILGIGLIAALISPVIFAIYLWNKSN